MNSSKLTNRQQERLILLIEEMGETAQIIGKTFCHGYAGSHPDSPHICNRMHLEKEIGDIEIIIEMLVGYDDIGRIQIDAHKAQKRLRKINYLHYHKNCIPEGSSGIDLDDLCQFQSLKLL